MRRCSVFCSEIRVTLKGYVSGTPVRHEGCLCRAKLHRISIMSWNRISPLVTCNNSGLALEIRGEMIYDFLCGTALAE